MGRYRNLSIVGLATIAITASAQTNTFPSTGNAGIGTTGPQYLLDVQSASDPIVSVGQTGYTVDPTVPTQVAGMRLHNQRGNGDKFVDIKAIVFPGQYTPSFVLATSPTYTTTPSDRFTIRESGLVGIGTDAPRTNLDVIGGIGGPSAFINVDSGTGNIGTVGMHFLHLDGADPNQQKVAILSDATGAYGKGNLRFAINTTNDSSNVSVSDTKLYIDGSTGNIGVGTTGPSERFEVTGNIKLSAPGSHIVFPDGSIQSMPWTGSLCGGDYAETVDVAGDRTSYEPGDVLVISSESGADVLKSAEPYSTSVTGIYSTKPGVVGRRQTTDPKTSTNEIPMAMVGIVPTKVSAENGPIKRGDLLVTSSTPGYAMKGTDSARMLGAIVGKALGNLGSGTGVIEVVVTLQ